MSPHPSAVIDRNVTTTEGSPMSATSYPPVGSPHPQGVPLNPALLETVRAKVEGATNPQVAAAVVRFLDNTSTTTVRRRGPRDTFVMTGDIPAMWLRDSCAQVAPLLRLIPEDPELATLIGGLLATHWRMILIDPYANAFNEEPNGNRWDDDVPEPSPWVWERKWEIDSLAYPIDLAARLLATGHTSWITAHTLPALDAALTVLETELDHEANSEYTFNRENCPPTDTLSRGGKGPLTSPCGLVWQGFRPSDDACHLGFNIPGNLFMAAALRAIPQLVSAVQSSPVPADPALAGSLDERAARLREGILAGVREHGWFSSADGTARLWYEVDGLGGHLFMDDANVPSLLSLPYLGVIAADDPRYLATRAAVLSNDNPFYYEGSALAGVGSPHTPEGFVWPIALSVEGLTSTDSQRRAQILDLLLSTTGGTGYMHEGVDKDDPTRFTREWFSWSNAMFCEVALEVAGFPRPALLAEPLLAK